MGGLRKAGLVTSVRGAQGGYLLSDPPEAMSVGHILRVLEGSVESGRRQAARRRAALFAAYASRLLWRELNQRVVEVLDSLTLADLSPARKRSRRRREYVITFKNWSVAGGGPMQTIYMDYAATTPLDDAVFAAMVPWLRALRQSVVAVCGARATAGGHRRSPGASGQGNRRGAVRNIFHLGRHRSAQCRRERRRWAMRGAGRGQHIVVSAIEHQAVLEAAAFLERQGFTVTRCPSDEFGVVHPESVVEAMTQRPCWLPSCMPTTKSGPFSRCERWRKGR